MRENDIDFQSNELGCELGEAFAASLRPAIFDRDGATFDPTEFAQSLHKGSGPLALRRCSPRAEQSDGRGLRLLRTRRDRPRGCRPAEQRDELAPFHYSITSSASASSVGGMSRPSSLAAFRLIAISNLVGCTTGRSAGLSPWRIRPA